MIYELLFHQTIFCF